MSEGCYYISFRSPVGSKWDYHIMKWGEEKSLCGADTEFTTCFVKKWGRN